MIVSPRSSSGTSEAIVESTNAAGTMIQTWRGGVRVSTNASSGGRAGHPGLAGERVDRRRVDVVADALVAGQFQAADHVGAHPAEADHAELHGGKPGT